MGEKKEEESAISLQWDSAAAAAAAAASVSQSVCREHERPLFRVPSATSPCPCPRCKYLWSLAALLALAPHTHTTYTTKARKAKTSQHTTPKRPPPYLKSQRTCAARAPHLLINITASMMFRRRRRVVVGPSSLSYLSLHSPRTCYCPRNHHCY